MLFPGKVFLVGAGPGEAGLITLRACQCLASADVVLFDYLVNPAVLEHAPRAQHVCLGRHGQGRIMPIEEVCRLMVEHARQGRSVVRLKAGDPLVFAHANEEIAALVAAQIRYEIVPGITAALAAGSYAGIPLTSGERASAVALVTGHQREGNDSLALDYSALAAFPGTLAFYMGATTAHEWTSALVAAGKPAETPAAIIRRCSWPDQQTILCPLGEVASRIDQFHVRPPVVVIVGEVVGMASAANWFTARPLVGQTVLVTRPRRQADVLVRRLGDLGAGVLAQPVIEISPPADWSAVDNAIDRVSDYDWLVFSSVNGVQYFLGRLLARRGDIRSLGPAKLAAIGPGTAEELARYHLLVGVVPAEYRAEALADVLAERASGKRMLLLRASRGREVLAERLRAAGASVDQVVVYESRDVEQPDADIAAALAAGRIDWTTVTSSAIARSLVRMFGADLGKSKLASISPITSDVLRQLGHEPAAEAEPYTIDGLVEAIVKQHHTS